MNHLELVGAGANIGKCFSDVVFGSSDTQICDPGQTDSFVLPHMHSSPRYYRHLPFRSCTHRDLKTTDSKLFHTLLFHSHILRFLTQYPLPTLTHKSHFTIPLKTLNSWTIHKHPNTRNSYHIFTAYNRGLGRDNTQGRAAFRFM